MTRSGRHPCIVRLGIWHRALDTRDIAKKLATESAEAVSDSANGHSLKYASRKSVIRNTGPGGCQGSKQHCRQNGQRQRSYQCAPGERAGEPDG